MTILIYNGGMKDSFCICSVYSGSILLSAHVGIDYIRMQRVKETCKQLLKIQQAVMSPAHLHVNPESIKGS